MQSDPVQEYLNELLSAVLRAKDAVQQLLIFSHQYELNLAPIKIDGIVKETLQFVKSSITAAIDIQKNIAQDVYSILADSFQISQVLIHLCTNAVHAMEEKGGILRIELKNVELDDADSKFLDLAPGRYVQLTVTDTGHGIDPEIRERIFDPYFTTKEVGKGAGGLAVVHGIVENHEGAVLVESEPEKGTMVTVYFPSVDEDTIPETTF